ncbi:hypothetical protein TUM17387_37600 [Shewanella carassii]|uniref:ESPR domain-containing protein n=1 Tax=Shewanella carassii TaxID=1987584 RepID=A0ABQ1T701_9GAMM|nr:hypothetical protein TUM17387_37600 [Shewanella carassii]GGE82290.1 hypothetical protein GCM10011520_23370 [Shewanella carassii]
MGQWVYFYVTNKIIVTVVEYSPLGGGSSMKQRYFSHFSLVHALLKTLAVTGKSKVSPDKKMDADLVKETPKLET